MQPTDQPPLHLPFRQRTPRYHRNRSYRNSPEMPFSDKTGQKLYLLKPKDPSEESETAQFEAPRNQSLFLINSELYNSLFYQ